MWGSSYSCRNCFVVCSVLQPFVLKLSVLKINGVMFHHPCFMLLSRSVFFGSNQMKSTDINYLENNSINIKKLRDLFSWLSVKWNKIKVKFSLQEIKSKHLLKLRNKKKITSSLPPTNLKGCQWICRTVCSKSCPWLLSFTLQKAVSRDVGYRL